MNGQLDTKLLNSLPEDVIMNHILPYTYLPQPPRLMMDVRSFYTDFSILENAYTYDFNYDVLIYDMICFCNRSRIPSYNTHNSFVKLLNRMFRMKKWTYSTCNNFVFVVFHRDVVLNPERKIKFLWGMLNPRERTLFINNYVIEDDYV
uniref:Uncharacterized protein n=1 Tax=viral metagenome TaxID=1070528 RepID=A0A6C0LBQ6_9ZZZZ